MRRRDFSVAFGFSLESFKGFRPRGVEIGSRQGGENDQPIFGDKVPETVASVFVVQIEVVKHCLRLQSLPIGFFPTIAERFADQRPTWTPPCNTQPRTL